MMKASLYNPQHFLFSLRISLLLVLVTITWHISVTECADLPLSGEVGGNVTIHCPFHKDRKILFLYFQKGDTFVNGYYEDREMDHKKVQKWSNTRLDRGNNTVYMYNLTVAHSGEYQCHIKYRSGVLMVNKIHLSVTANYSKPEVKQYCSGEVGGNVTIHCPFHKDRKILFLYFQKGDTFVNGYYEDREMDHKKVQKWSNTRLDRGNNTVYMYNLTVAHSGEYQCHIKYRSGVLMENKIHLSVTGMCVFNLTFKNVFDCLSSRLIAGPFSNILQHYDGIILYIQALL
ncbi:uncharacterized protein LOC127362741 isoform X1 [Dicentrarchus labrax]|uniref:Immunoglobulin domain-containing protein n=1 Tax=Dicentrarchus labrax TaxID=13489 RepID=A0A8P4G5V6_DICLA|nr:uncharacterized protein LOC127362741 isoform X1 [Dicentrarchus labrax]